MESYKAGRKKYEGAPSWVQEYLEGLDYMKDERHIEALEKEWPGIGEIFDQIIRMLPDPDDPNKSEFPFSAAVIKKDREGKARVLAMSTNQVNALNDPTAHAEVVAIREAAEIFGKHLEDCALLSTVEPCGMCSVAITHAEIKTLVYGATQEDLKGTHVKFSGPVYKPNRTTPAGVNTDLALTEAGVRVFSGYKREDVLRRLHRLSGTFKEYYQDPDA